MPPSLPAPTAHRITRSRCSWGVARCCAFALATCGSVAVASADGPPAPIVETDGERLLGAFFGDGPAEVVFKSIPFAAAPTGALRWRPPRSHAPRTGLQEALQFAPACPQPSTDNGTVEWYRQVAEAFGQADAAVPRLDAASENCLFLNVWTANWDGAQKVPVMVWIHGGSNQTGWSFEPLYHGEALARRGVVVVSIAYRLGEFGFLAHPALTHESPERSSGNYGLLDQIAALEWVQRNIAAFGGDPAQVTVFGESAGAANVAYLMATPLARGLFHAAISQSGGYPISDFRTLADEEARGERLAAALGLQDAEDALERLRSVSTAAILAAARATGPHDYAPNVDGWVLPELPARIFAEGRQLPVPLLIGANADEWSMYTDPDLRPGDLEGELRRTYGRDAHEVLAALASVGSDRGGAEARWRTDDYFVCPSLFMARSVYRAGGSAHVYFFSRRLPGPGGASLGAYHGAELPYVFDTVDPWLPWTAADRDLASSIARYWVSFTADGDPNLPGLPPWPRFDARERYLELGDAVEVRSHLHADVCAVYDRVIVRRLESQRTRP